MRHVWCAVRTQQEGPRMFSRSVLLIQWDALPWALWMAWFLGAKESRCGQYLLWLVTVQPFSFCGFISFLCSLYNTLQSGLPGITVLPLTRHSAQWSWFWGNKLSFKKKECGSWERPYVYSGRRKKIKFRDLHLLVGCSSWIHICFKTVLKHGVLWPIFSSTVFSVPVITTSFNV